MYFIIFLFYNFVLYVKNSCVICFNKTLLLLLLLLCLPLKDSTALCPPTGRDQYPPHLDLYPPISPMTNIPFTLIYIPLDQYPLTLTYIPQYPPWPKSPSPWPISPNIPLDQNPPPLDQNPPHLDLYPPWPVSPLTNIPPISPLTNAPSPWPSAAGGDTPAGPGASQLSRLLAKFLMDWVRGEGMDRSTSGMSTSTSDW